MTGEDYGEIVEAEVDGGKIVYTAEHPDGRELRGVLSKDIGPFIVLSESAMEDLAEQIVGETVEWPDQQEMVGER